MVGTALTATHRTMKTTRPTTSRAALTTTTATTRSVATWRSMAWAVPIQVRPRKTRYQQTKKPNAARQQGELVEDHPDQGERGQRRRHQQEDVGAPKSLGRSGEGRRRGVGDRRRGGPSDGGPAGDRVRVDSVPVEADVLGMRTPGGAVGVSVRVVTGRLRRRCGTG